MTSPPISVVIITYNEEVNIRHALDSVAWCDNVLVIDSFSTDATAAICAEYSNVTFITNPFINLARQRQFALESGLVQHEWVLALDADEIVPADLREELAEIAGRFQPGEPVAYDTALRIIMWNKWLKYSSEYPVYWRRFFRKSCVRYVQRGHADTVDVTGPIGRTRNDLIHHDRKGLSDWLAKHNKYTTQEAAYALQELRLVPLRHLFSRDRLMRRRALKRIFRFMPGSATARFIYLYFVRRGFFDGVAGYRLCVLRAQQAYLVQLKMQEMQECERANPIGLRAGASPSSRQNGVPVGATK